MRIAICEDDIQVCNQIKKLIIEHNNSSCIIKTYYSGDSLWFDYQGLQQPYDLLILDIEMPGELNGLNVAKKIRLMKDNIPIVILTAFEKYALEGYDVHPLHYLVKPVQKLKLFEIIDQIQERMKMYWENSLNLTIQGGFLRIPFDDIIYLESRAHNVFIHTKEQEYRLYRKLDEIYQLCDERFIPVHKSYIVNANMIKQIENRYTKIKLRNGDSVPISQQKKGDFIKTLMEYDLNYVTCF